MTYKLLQFLPTKLRLMSLASMPSYYGYKLAKLYIHPSPLSSVAGFVNQHATQKEIFYKGLLFDQLIVLEHILSVFHCAAPLVGHSDA